MQMGRSYSLPGHFHQTKIRYRIYGSFGTVIGKEFLKLLEQFSAVFPVVHIYEIEDQIVIVTDVPGASEDSIEITLEKNVLTINAYIEPEDMAGYALAWSEYQVGDYQRSFKLSNEIDQTKIEAVVNDGVLRLYLPKAAEAKTRKISVKAA